MWHIPDELLDRLVRERSHHHMPSQIRPLAQAFAGQVMGVLFPHFAAAVVCNEDAVREDLIEVAEALARLERAVGTLHEGMPNELVPRFMSRLVETLTTIEEDASAIYQGDPAAKSVDEVILTYPGFYAIAVFRVAHLLHELGLPLLPRLLTEHAHQLTGVDIHPGATIGRRFCIDHGTGVVIGETSHIGQGVKVYQGVTLGALTVDKAQADTKRHPTIEDEVVIYAGATILGGSTVVGHHSVVAGNAWLTHSVPPHSIVSRRSEVRPRSGADDLEWVI